MSTTITRLYASREQADAAVSLLKGHGLYAAEIHRVDGSAGNLPAAILQGGVPQGDAMVYAPLVAAGASLVSATARFGLAAKAMKSMDSCKPMETAVETAEHFNGTKTEATPLSTFLNIPTLSGTRTPFASFWNLPGLARRTTPFSSLLGMPTLTGIKTFTPFSGRRSNPTPLSSTLGLPTLSHNPTPVSSALGLPTLSKRKAR